MDKNIHFTDIETTGLHPTYHVPWDIGICDLNREVELRFLLELTPKERGTAEPMALSITNYYTKQDVDLANSIPENGNLPQLQGAYFVPTEDREALAKALAIMLDGTILAGNVVSFDALRLNRFMCMNGFTPTWHYHLLDVEAFAAGALGMAPPYKSSGSSDAISERLGVKPPEGDDKHTGLADALWARDIYEAALALHSPPPPAAFDSDSLTQE